MAGRAMTGALPADDDPGAAVTVGILNFGELGAAVADLLIAASVRVVTTVGGRSDATIARSNRIGVETLESIADVVDAADIVMSLVLPEAAVEVAEACSTAADEASRRNTVYLDANSIGVPMTRQIDDLVTASGFDFVAGSIRGGAARLRVHGTLYLSGPSTDLVSEVFSQVIPVRAIGGQEYGAKDLKLLIGGVAKGVNLLMLDLAALASQVGLYDDFRAELADFYPELSSLFDRFVPTFPLHVHRRRAEMSDLVALGSRHGVSASMVCGAEEDLIALADVLEPEIRSLRAIVDLVAREGQRRSAGLTP